MPSEYALVHTGRPRRPRGGRVAALQSALYARDPYAYSRVCLKRYGDPFTVPLLMGDIVVTATPAGVAELFSIRTEQVTAWGTEELGPLLGDFSVIQSHGQTHRRDRRLISPSLHGEQLHRGGLRMRTMTRSRVALWRSGDDIRVDGFTQELSIDIIIATVFGISELREQAAWRRAVADYVAAIHPSFLFFKALRHEWFGFSRWARFRRASDQLDALIHNHPERRRTQKAEDDVLSALLAARFDDGARLQPREIRDQLVALLFAGHETTAIALTWALYLLHTHPQVLKKLRDELDGADPELPPRQLAALPYLDAVCKETLRLFPVVPDIARRLLEPLEFRGYDLPAGMGVGACISAAHRDPTLFEDPLLFRPERFLERKYGPHEFFPFGGGHRRCLGAAFACIEMAIVLSEVLRAGSYTLRTRDEVAPRRRNVTTGPGRPIVLRKE